MRNRRRPKLLAAAAAAAGLAAFGTVAAQQPPASPTGQPKMSSAPGGTFPGSTVRPYGEWNPNAPPPPGYQPKQPQAPTAPGGVMPAGGTVPALQPVGGYQPPPGYRPVGGTGGNRLTQPVQAGPEGVRPAGGVDLPPPAMDVPTFRPGQSPAAAPTIPNTPAPPAIPPSDAGDSKFGGPQLPVPVPVPGATDPRPSAPVVPPATVNAPPLTVPAAPGGPASPVTPIPTAPVNPVPNTPANPVPSVTAPAVPNVPAPTTPAPTNPQTLPQFNPTGPAATTTPAPTGPGATPTTPAPAVGAMSAQLPTKAAPSVQVEAVGPDTVAFGQEYAYKLVVRNTGHAAVANVRIDEELPTGCRFVASDPTAEQSGDRLVWLVGTMDANSEKVIQVRVKPTEEGELRSRATVSFAASVDAKTRVTRPRLVIAVTGAEVSRAGEETTFQIKVTNSGTGPASKMVLQARLSDGLVHPQGMVIEAELANLPAGDSRSVPLKVNSARAGLQACEIVVTADGSPEAKARAAVNVVEPMLVVKQAGPAHCLVRAEPTYTIELSNPGTAATDPVTVHSVLPDGFEYVAASDGGTLNGRTVTWKLPSLAAGSSRAVTLKLRAAAAAEGALRTLAQTASAAPAAQPAAVGAVRSATRGLEAKAESPVTAEGVAAVRFEVIDVEDPVEAGKEAVYEIRVTNQGTGPCTNVQLAAALADGTEFVGATGGPNQQAQVRAAGQGLVFDPIPTLGVKGEVVYRVRVKGTIPGDHRFRVQLTCDQLKTPVIKEESTRFYKE